MGPDVINFGANIRAFRKQKEDVSHRVVGKNRYSGLNLSSIELGKSFPTLNTLMKIAAVF